MAKSEAQAPSSRSSEAEKDDEFGKEFLDSWKSISVSKDDPIDFNFSVGPKGNKGFDFGKLDMDFDIGSGFTNMKAFDIDIPDVDFGAPTKKAPKEKEKGEASKCGTNKRRDSMPFNFDFNELDDFNFDSSLEKKSGKVCEKRPNAEPNKADLEDPQWKKDRKGNSTENAKPSEFLDKKACIGTKERELEITKQNEKGPEDSNQFDVSERKGSDEIVQANTTYENTKKLDIKDYKMNHSSDTSACMKNTYVLAETTTEISHDIRSDEADFLPLNSMPAAQEIHKRRTEDKRLSTAAQISKVSKPALFELVFQATPTETPALGDATNSNPSSFAPTASKSDVEPVNKIQEADKSNEVKLIATNIINKRGNAMSLRASSAEIPKLKGFVVDSQKSKQLYSNISRLKITGVTETPKIQPFLSNLNVGKKEKLTKILHSDVKPIHAKDLTSVKRKSFESLTADVAARSLSKRQSTSLIWNFKKATESQNKEKKDEIENTTKVIESEVPDTWHVSAGEFEVTPYVADYDNAKEAEACAKELDDLCEMLKKKLNDAKEVMAKAVMDNNSLLMLNHLSLRHKIGLLQKVAKEAASESRQGVDPVTELQV